MLVLLIIFMIVTPIIAAGFQATIPRGEHPEDRPEGPDEVRLGIDRDGKYYLDLGDGPRQVKDADLPGRLEAIYASRAKDKILFLKADQNLDFARVQQAIVLELLPDGGYAINKQAYSKDQLGPTLQQLYENRPAKLMFIKAAPNRKYGEVVDAMDLAHAAGVQVIGFTPAK